MVPIFHVSNIIFNIPDICFDLRNIYLLECFKIICFNAGVAHHLVFVTMMFPKGISTVGSPKPFQMEMPAQIFNLKPALRACIRKGFAGYLCTF